ncbi:formate dehydrogenase subunit alpha [Ferrimonas pelagia]|uniref:Formate dehydrogenase subunit alpha n=1 Tax=Ferrimonas pelagia TaxID=1177826 RepID=A0ABP9FH34_9GAMM
MINISLNSVQLQAPMGVRLLDWLRQQGINVPSLCGASANAQKTPCDLCVVEVNGALVRSCELSVTQAMAISTSSDAITEQRRAALTRLLADHPADCEAPCKTACPADVDIQSYLYHIAQGDAVRANAVVKQSLPMPLSIGRVCPAFCESECRRSVVDEPLAIRQLKRHAADLDLAQKDPDLAPIAAPIGKRVAIIGAGPAGLAAGYSLSHGGVEVDVFEAMPEAGGWLRYGIPEYRLPKATLAKEIALMCRAGMKIHTDRALGRDLDLAQLKHDYDAVCLAVGAQKAVAMDYPGSDLHGVVLGVDYLKQHALGHRFDVGQRVAVIGGGNTAIDCARTALRQGAEVTIVYRRGKADMPAEPYEIHEAEEEGIRFLFLSQPVENLGNEQGRVARVKIEALALGEPDSSGRRRPQPTGQFSWHEFDTVIPAVSQKPDTSFIPDGAILLTQYNTADTCPDTYLAGSNNLFAIGDFRLGPATAVEAIGEGRRSAEAMLRLFRDGGLTCVPAQFSARKAEHLKQVEARIYGEIVAKPRQRMATLEGLDRSFHFGEVELGFTPEQAISEAARCLSCGCQKSEDCALRDCATEYRIKDEEIATDPARVRPIDESTPFIRLDPNRCIGCGHCVEACTEQGVHGALTLTAAGAGSRVSPTGADLAHSGCVQCGACVQACPVGAITARTREPQTRSTALNAVDTLCTYCGVGCGVRLHVDPARNRVVEVTGVTESPVNQGMLCVKGRFGFDFLHSPQRLTQPLIRRGDQLVPTSWPIALHFVADKLMALKAQYGGAALAGISSAKTTNEDNYLFQKFVRTVLASNNVDHCARLCHATTVTGLEPAIGSGAMTNDIAGIAESDLILIIGSDTANAHPVIASHIKQAIKRHGARLVVIDPKRTDMVDHALMHLQQRPGSDVMLLNAVMQQILLGGWQDEDYIAARTEGFERLRQEIEQPCYEPERAEAITGVPAAQIRRLARLIGQAEKTAVFYAMGITQHSTGTDNVRSLANLQLMCGNVGVTGAGINPLRGQSNVQGACDMGALPDYMPGYQKLLDPAVTRRFEQHWQTPLPSEPGLKLTEMFGAMQSGDLKGLYIMGENPVLSDPDQAHVLAALKSLDLLVVQDLFLTETAQLADVVLPAVAFAEKEGHFTNTERRVQRLHRALQPPAGASTDWEILQYLAQYMGHEWHYPNVRAIHDELCRVTPQYGGISWERTLTESLQWPCPTPDHPGTPVMHMDGFSRVNKAQFAAVAYRGSAERADADYPLVLTTGRQLAQFHTGTLSRKTAGLEQLAQPKVMISVEDAESLGIGNGDRVRVQTRRGEVTVPAFVTRRMQMGVIFMPFHFVEAAANVLTHAALDPEAKIPEFKVSAARVRPVAMAQVS